MNRRLSAAFLTVSVTVALPLLAGAPASAVTVTVGSTDYDVTIFNGSYNSNSASFQVPPTGVMPWWGNDQLALEFAAQVYDRLGSGPTTGSGPVFAYEDSGTDIQGWSQSITDLASQNLEMIAYNVYVNYAIVTPLNSAAASVPVPLPVFGAAAAFGWSRQLRKRATHSCQAKPEI